MPPRAQASSSSFLRRRRRQQRQQKPTARPRRSVAAAATPAPCSRPRCRPPSSSRSSTAGTTSSRPSTRTTLCCAARSARSSRSSTTARPPSPSPSSTSTLCRSPPRPSNPSPSPAKTTALPAAKSTSYYLLLPAYQSSKHAVLTRMATWQVPTRGNLLQVRAGFLGSLQRSAQCHEGCRSWYGTALSSLLLTERARGIEIHSAMRAELKGVNAIFSIGMQRGLCVPLAAIIDYRGFRYLHAHTRPHSTLPTPSLTTSSVPRVLASPPIASSPRPLCRSARPRP